jgi:type I restriction enzyme S subunit
MRGNLPKNWVQTDLETIIERMSNGSGLQQFEEPFDNSFPISRIETIWNETIDLDRVKYVNPTKADIEKYSFLKGDVLFSHINSDKHLGKTAVFNLDSILIHGINLLLLRAQPQFNGYLLNYFLRYYRLTGKFIEVAQRSVNQSSINQKKLNTFKIPLPPLAEQNRIVEKLDRLFTQLETIKTRIEYLNGIADRFTYSCLVDSKKSKFHPREKIGRFLEEGKGRIGEDWKGLRLIGVSAKQGITDLRTGQKESFEKYKVVRPGDFIYNTMRVNIGSIAIYKGSVNALTSPDYVVFRVSKHLSSQLLLNFLKSDSGLLEIGANTKGSVRARLYFKALSDVRMPIAPIEIQNLAENFLKGFKNNLMTLNELKKTKLERLSQSILHKTFKGELSEQLDSDGDAKELLKQIQELKNSTVKPKKATTTKTKMYAEENEMLGMVAEPVEFYKK